MMGIDIARGLLGLVTLAIVVGIVLGVVFTKGCEYLSDRVDVNVEWKSK